MKNCNKVGKFKKLKTILVKSKKMRRRFDVRLKSLSRGASIKSIMSEMRTNTNAEEFLTDTDNKEKICK